MMGYNSELKLFDEMYKIIEQKHQWIDWQQTYDLRKHENWDLHEIAVPGVVVVVVVAVSLSNRFTNLQSLFQFEIISV